MSPRTSSKAFESSTIDAEAPCELLIKVKPESGTCVEAFKLAVVEFTATLRLNRRFIAIGYAFARFELNHVMERPYGLGLDLFLLFL